MTTPEVSVIIATRNRAGSLKRLLSALHLQTTPPFFEVVIADNGSTDDTNSIITQTATQMPIQSIYVKKPGKAHAINAALKMAKGELIVFTDDDIQPPTDWLQQLFSAMLRHPEINIFGGQIEVNTDVVPQWILNSNNLMGLLTSAHHHGVEDTIYSYGQYPFGPNMAIHRELLVDVESPYPESIGPGTAVPVGDETVFFQQFSHPGAKDRMYIPSALVIHKVEAENLVFRKVLGRCFLGGRAHGQYAQSPSILSNNQKRSMLRLIRMRIASCHSFRELACIFIRLIGHLYGHYLMKCTYARK